MAVTVTPVLAGSYINVSDVEATADGDTQASVPHGLSGTPAVVLLTNLDQAAAELSAWAATGIGGVNTIVEKSTATGSGTAGAQVRVTAMLPHSLIS